MAYSCDIQVPWDLITCANQYTNGIVGLLIVLAVWFISFSWLQGKDGDMAAATVIAMGTSAILFLGNAVSEYVVFAMLILTPIVVMMTRR